MTTYHSECPKDRVVAQEPRLFGEPGNVPFLGYPPPLRERIQSICHEASAQAGEKNNAECEKVAVAIANAILPRGWVVM
jgi:hypothetical protein